MQNPIISVIGAYTYGGDNAYGLGDKMPWFPKIIPGDLPFFAKHTTNAPDGKVNVLISGYTTAKTMEKILLGNKRILIGVSRKIECSGESNGQGRYLVNSIELALQLANELNAHRIIFIGGEVFWLRGLEYAHEAYLTVVHKRCLDPRAIRLTKPLHISADESGLTLVKRKFFDNKGIDDAWAQHHECQTWKR